MDEAVRARSVVRRASTGKWPTVEATIFVMYAALVANSAFAGLALSEARAALAAGDLETAWEWLETLPPSQRPLDLVAACSEARSGAAASGLDARSRAAASEGQWNRAQQLAAEAVKALSTPPRQERLGLLRRRRPLQDDKVLKAISAAVSATVRLDADALLPEVDTIAACGAYYSRGAGRGAPWSRYLRMSKAPPAEDDERRTIFSYAGKYFSRFIVEETDLLKVAEVVVPVPANPERYGDRMASLPDELARATEDYLALRMLPNAIAWVPGMTHVEMKKLSRADRRHLATLAFRPGNQANNVAGRGVLLVDDIMTSGSTLRACARVLRDAGATRVVACCLAHTEG